MNSLTALKKIDLSNHKLSGTSHLAFLNSPDLLKLISAIICSKDLTSNAFEGHISYVAKMTALTQLGLNNNRFTGTVPTTGYFI